MRRLIMLLFCAVCTVSMTFAQDAKKKKDSVTFFIEAMDCDHCIKKIEKNIAFEKGVTDLKCDLSTRTAIVTYKTDKTSKTRLAAAFKKIGMEAVPVDNGAGCPVPPAKKSRAYSRSLTMEIHKNILSLQMFREAGRSVRPVYEIIFLRNAAFV